MRKWCKELGFVALCLVGFESSRTAAFAQHPGGLPGDPTFGGMHAPAPLPVGYSSICPPQSNSPAPPVNPAAITLPNDGSPNSFSEFNPCCGWYLPVFWAGADYVHGYTKWRDVPVPLVTTSTNPNAISEVGALGQANTIVLSRRAALDLRNPSGVRVVCGFSPTPEFKLPVEVTYTYLSERTTAFSFQSDEIGRPLLARPVQSTTPGQEGETVFLSSFPFLATGGIDIDGSLQVWGIQAHTIVRTGLEWGDEGYGARIDFPIGMRYLNLNDVLAINNRIESIDASFGVPFLGLAFGPGNRTFVTDMFKATNEFRGGEFGVRYEYRHGSFSLMMEPRVSIGSTNRAVIISGRSVLEQPGNGNQQNNQTAAPAGILAVQTNSGHHASEQFTVLPEGRLYVAWDLFHWMRLQLGYEVTYWPDIARSADHVNRAVDLRQVPTDFSFTNAPGTDPNSPIFRLRDSNFFLQTASIGLTFFF